MMISNILVVGDVMLDKYLIGTSTRMSPEAPVPIVKIEKMVKLPGGAANVASLIANMKVNCLLLGTVGSYLYGKIEDYDLDGYHLKKMLTIPQLHPMLLFNKEITTVKTRFIVNGIQLARIDEEVILTKPEIHRSVKNNFKSAILADKNIKVVVFSDYGKGTLGEVQEMIKFCCDRGIVTLVDPKGLNWEKYKSAAILTPNMSEFEAVVGKCNSEQEIHIKADKLIKELDLEALLITRSDDGMTLISDTIYANFKTDCDNVVDVCGAGDMVIATLAVNLAQGKSLIEAVKMSEFEATLSVQKSRLGNIF